MASYLEDFPEAAPVHLSDVGSSLKKGTKLFVGRLFTIHGSVPEGADRFSFNLFAGNDTALHVDCRFGEGCVVRNSCVSGEWLAEEREGGLPLAPGAFEMMIAAEEGHFKVAFGGQHFAEFVHRLPPALIDAVSINGDVHIASFQESQAPHSFGLFGLPLQPILNDDNMHGFEIHKGMRPGRKIHIGAVPTGGTFIVDLRPDVSAEDIGLHVSCRVDEGVVVLNSREGQEWQQDVLLSNMPFAAHQPFDLLIAASDTGFSLVLNGSATTNFFPIRHIKAKKLKGLVIHSAVKVNFVTVMRED